MVRPVMVLDEDKVLVNQGGIIKFALWELAAFFKYFARVSVNC